MTGSDDRQDERGGKSSAEEPEERTDGWMTTYSDMVTLLMTFFVLMFAISNVDNQKAMLFFAGMSRDGLSAAEFDRIVEMFNPGDDMGEIYFPNVDIWYDGTSNDEDLLGDPGNEALTNLYQEMHAYIQLAGLSEHIQLQFNGEFLLMTLRDDILFELGRAEVLPDMRYVAAYIAELISGTHNPANPFEIVVTGHTDNLPIATAEFPSNWDLSVRRAVNLMRILIQESGIDPYFFQARGASEYRPIDTNDTAEGRRRNRRVEVMVTVLRESDAAHGNIEAEDTFSTAA